MDLYRFTSIFNDSYGFSSIVKGLHIQAANARAGKVCTNTMKGLKKQGKGIISITTDFNLSEACFYNKYVISYCFDQFCFLRNVISNKIDCVLIILE